MDLFGPEPVTIWDVIRHWAGRPMLTRLLKDHGKDAVKQAAIKTLTDEAVEQLPYMIECLKERDDVAQAWQMSDDDLMALATERNLPTKGKTRQQLINELR